MQNFHGHTPYMLRLIYLSLLICPSTFNRSITVRKSQSSSQRCLFPFQALGKRLQVGNATAETFLQPGVKWLSISFPHHLEEPLYEVVGGIESFYLTNKSELLLFLRIEATGIT